MTELPAASATSTRLLWLSASVAYGLLSICLPSGLCLISYAWMLASLLVTPRRDRSSQPVWSLPGDGGISGAPPVMIVNRLRPRTSAPSAPVANDPSGAPAENSPDRIVERCALLVAGLVIRETRPVAPRQPSSLQVEPPRPASATMSAPVCSSHESCRGLSRPLTRTFLCGAADASGAIVTSPVSARPVAATRAVERRYMNFPLE